MEALSTYKVKEFVYYWFKKLTDHAPMDELLSMLHTEDLLMKFPETVLQNENDFRKWYKTVTNKFFDQVHEIKMLEVSINGDTADVHLIVNWQARTWNPPDPYSKWEGVYAHQNWQVIKDRKTGKPVIRSYIVRKFDPMESKR